MTNFSALPDFGSIDVPLRDPADGDLLLWDPTAGDLSEPEPESTEFGAYGPAALAVAILADIPPVRDEDEYLNVSECSVPEASRTTPSAYEQATFPSSGRAMSSAHEQAMSSQMRTEALPKGLSRQ